MRLESPGKLPTIGAGAALAKSNKAAAAIVAWTRGVVGSMAPNGEVEGPDDHVGQAPRAHTLPKRPRRQSDHASRTPPTIVRRRRHPSARTPVTTIATTQPARASR